MSAGDDVDTSLFAVMFSDAFLHVDLTIVSFRPVAARHFAVHDGGRLRMSTMAWLTARPNSADDQCLRCECSGCRQAVQQLMELQAGIVISNDNFGAQRLSWLAKTVI